MLVIDEAFVDQKDGFIEVTMGSDFVRLYNLSIEDINRIIEQISDTYGNIDDMEEFYDASGHLMEDLTNAEMAL